MPLSKVLLASESWGPWTTELVHVVCQDRPVINHPHTYEPEHRVTSHIQGGPLRDNGGLSVTQSTRLMEQPPRKTGLRDRDIWQALPWQMLNSEMVQFRSHMVPPRPGGWQGCNPTGPWEGVGC